MAGGAGNDVYVVDALGDTVMELANAGTDGIEASVSWTLGANVENLSLTGAADLSATGNALANLLRGNSGANLLDGATGNDTMVGGAGNDIYRVDATGDVITELAAEGSDRVESSVTLSALAANVEDLTLLGATALSGTGNALDNVMVGNAAANTLTGLGGNDRLDGAGGDDTLVGGTGADLYRFGIGAGIDTIRENDSTAGTVDAVDLQGVSQSQVTYKRVGNNLELLLNGTSDKLVVQDWYLGSQYQVEELRFADQTVLNTQVQSLVTAMASFGAPAASASTAPAAPMVYNHMVTSNVMPT